MNKPVAFICACIAGLGLLILGRGVFLAVAYGRGNLAAADFNRCWYSSSRNATTGEIVRDWGEIGESTEDGLIQRLDMGCVGFGLVILGGCLYAAESGTRRQHDSLERGRHRSRCW